MPTFHYQVLDGLGKKRKGYIEAESQTRAMALLQKDGFMPLKLESVRRKAGGPKRWSFSLSEILPSSKVKVSESFYYLGMLLQSGTSLAQSLDMLGRMSSGRGSRIWMDIRDSVESGETFSEVLKRHGKAFPNVYVGMIRVAESVGRLGPVLEQIARHEEARSEVTGRLYTAMIYPLVILLVGLGAAYFLLTGVLPKIATIFEQTQQELPLNTRVLMAVGEFFASLGPAGLVLPLLVLLAVIMAFRKVPRLRRRLDRALWSAPLVQRHILARFSGMLGFQLEAGIPMVQALESSADSVNSEYFKEHIRQAQAEVATGQPLHKVLADQGIYPDLYIMTLSTGQKAGKLGDFLQRIARVLEKEVDNIVKRLVALAEPLLILVVGLMIGFIVLAIMGPIFDLSKIVR
jgi:general secretion pathway protein F/type IV pilus assembly protein PilC